MKYSLIWSFSPGCDQSIERLCYWRLEWQNTDVQVNTLSMNSEAGHFWHSSCHHKPTKSWHSVVQYLYQDTSATSCKKYQNRKKEMLVLIIQKAMTGNMWWQQVAFMSGHSQGHVCTESYIHMICCGGTVGRESTASHSLAVMREIIG